MDKTIDDKLKITQLMINKLPLLNIKIIDRKIKTLLVFTELLKVFEPTNKTAWLKHFGYQCNLQFNVPSLPESLCV